MTEMELRLKVCEKSRSWLGKKEADGSHREIIDLYNEHRPAGSYKMSYVDPWCAAFVSAVGMACGLGDILLPHINCDGMIAAYKAKGRWQEADNYPAQIGDLIFYDWQDSGVGDNTGSADHVGLIVGVTENAYTVIEGNISDAVGYRTVYRNQRYIRGFACPDYASVAGEDEPAKVPEESTPDELELGEPAVFNLSTGLVPLPTLRRGDKSEAVRNAQRLLIGHGYYCGGKILPDGREDPDGEFGPWTAREVAAFQQLQRIQVDGVIGPETWARLITT